MVRKAAFTICAENYLARAAVLMRSVACHLPEHEPVLVLAAARLPAALPPGLPAGCRVLMAADIGARRLELRRLVYDVTEFCTSIKPDVFAHLFRGGYDEVLYFDPDVMLFGPLPEVAAAWDAGADIVLTPHVVSTRRHPDWVMRAVGVSGQFNLGFIGLRRTPTARRMLGWWGEEVALHCIEDVRNGRFVDQKVADFVVSLFPGYRAIRHPGYNVAYWNLHERPLTEVEGAPHAAGVPLRFFHFSGFGMFRDTVSRHLGHFAVATGDGGPALRRILQAYADALLAQGELGFAARPYEYDRPAGDHPGGGIATSRALRRGLLAAATGEDPDDGLPTDGRIDPETLTAPVRRVAGRRFPRPVPRFLALLLAGGELPAAASALVEAWIAAPPAARPAAMTALLETLHVMGAVDPRVAERLAETDAVGPVDAMLPARMPPGSLAAACEIAIEDGTATATLPSLLLLIHRVRPDLAARFPLDRWSGVVGYAAWFLAEGHRVHAFPPDLLDALLAALDRPAERHEGAGPSGPEPGETPFAAAMRQGHLDRADGGGDDRTEPAAAPQLEIAAMERLLDADLERRTDAERRVGQAWLWAKDGAAVPRVMRLLRASAALRRRLSDALGTRQVSLPQIDSALRTYGLDQVGSPPGGPDINVLAGAVPVRASAAGQATPHDLMVGPFKGVSGVGASAQGMLTLLRAGGRRVDAVDLFDDPEAAGGVNAPAGLALFHVNADISVDTVAKFHAAWAAAGRRVAYWAWELPCMTRRMAAPARLFDEIWVPTEFVRRAVAAGTDVPVRVVPPAIDPAAFAPGDATGGTFGRGKRGYRFLAVADARSYLSRKNPEGAVRAFRMAFPGGDEPAELVVKLSHGHCAQAETARLHDLATADERIRFLDGILPQTEMNDLYQSADCVVSLHRSEGNGLVIVQAMMMGRPVIATGYSGPMDFLTGTNAFLVPWVPMPPAPSAYPDWLGQTWAEPDTQAAALFMRELVRDPSTGVRIGKIAQTSVVAQLSHGRPITALAG